MGRERDRQDQCSRRQTRKAWTQVGWSADQAEARQDFIHGKRKHSSDHQDSRLDDPFREVKKHREEREDKEHEKDENNKDERGEEGEIASERKCCC